MKITLNEQQANTLIEVLENPFLTVKIANKLNSVLNDEKMTTLELTDYNLKFVIE